MSRTKKAASIDIKNAWNGARERIAEAIGNRDTYSRWVEGIIPLSFEGDVLLLGVSDEFTADWIKTHFEPMIKNALSETLGAKFKISYEVGHQSPDISPQDCPAVNTRSSNFSNNESRQEEIIEEKAGDFTFNSYVVGPENRFAFAAAYGAATGEGMIPNPLFIYGSTSCGKTHLMKAITNEVRKNRKGKVVEYVSCENFLNIYVDSLRKRTHYEFRNRFRSVDFLLIDDIHFMATAPKLQEEFFNTFNCLHGENKVIMLTSDKMPSEINGLESRLVSRFESGLTLEIEPYGEETRLAILRKKQEKHSVKISDDILRFVARNINSHVRKLEGALNRLIGALIYAGCDMTIENAEMILKPYLEEAASNRVTIEKIQKTVADHYDLRVSDLTGKKRPNNIAVPRMVAMFLCRKLTDRSLPDIGEAFGRNHATVIHAVNKIEKDSASDSILSGLLSQLKRRVQSSV